MCVGKLQDLHNIKIIWVYVHIGNVNLCRLECLYSDVIIYHILISVLH